ncbi:MAG: LPS export ABC transporter permease LptF [Deltaproteobacteria bacterium]|jgi:lipopolysaccharide export system permease protein|nr:LPS export ABC transporter permease LptF [Deltaproteobacteria bacterium]MBW2520779.1 LPS export ABC transporter permease LptF [Deltaproteobacteria bacterium]
MPIMLSSKINRYIAWEVLGPTILCLLVFTLVLLMGRLVKLVDLVVNKGVSIGDILLLFGTMLPTFLNVTLPLAFLMGVMIGLGRMSTDSETVALKAAGIGLSDIAKPVLSIALICAIITGVAGIWLKPWGYHSFRQQIFNIAKQKATIGFQPQVFMKHFDNMVLYANNLDNRSGAMSDLFIVENGPEATSMIFADQGHINVNDRETKITFQLQDGTMHRQAIGQDSSYQLINFHHYDVQPALAGLDNQIDDKPKDRKLRPKEMKTALLWEQIENYEQGRQTTNSLHAMQAELHTRLTAPLAPFLFALFGLPFSIQAHRSGRSGGFVMGLIIYLVYFSLLSLAETSTAETGVTPWLSFWLPHALLVLLSLYCLKQSAHERPIVFVSWVENLLANLSKRFRSDHVNR